ncbi:hypothetical protein AVEN_85207-1 [Araneus ventricosus]|uniref:Uncharacterized protein n=1 Tax=Araneus ventricosus TaxID=182803 RepID=A0A4Y2EBT8_ARAVE|nr:hypothetical protein AVEN_85207-1 [Araneus ventricosus]
MIKSDTEKAEIRVSVEMCHVWGSIETDFILMNRGQTTLVSALFFSNFHTTPGGGCLSPIPRRIVGSKKLYHRRGSLEHAQFSASFL